MPELPEVEVVRRGVDAHMVGSLIESVTVFEPRSVRRHPGGELGFRADLEGSRVVATGRRGKFMWLVIEPTSSDANPLAEQGGKEATYATVMVHLGMSGQVRMFPDVEGDVRGQSHFLGKNSLVEPASEGPQVDGLKHVRIQIHARHCDGRAVRADFVDQRIFGGMWVSDLSSLVEHGTDPNLVQTEMLPVDVGHISRDVLDPKLDRKGVADRIRKSRAGIKSLLLDQSVVSGIGNIYADEALWAMKMHGEKPGKSLSVSAVYGLLDAAAVVMQNALDQGGTSFDALYVNVDGRQGYFARSLQAYGKEGDACSRCSTLMVREKFMNRSSHFCPLCQRKR